MTVHVFPVRDVVEHGNRPGEIAQDGEWICVRCVVLLELAEGTA